MAERVWLAGNGGRKAPSSQQAEFDRLVTDLSDERDRQDVDPGPSSWAHAADPRRRLQAVNRWPCLETLLDLATDSHPLVRAAAVDAYARLRHSFGPHALESRIAVAGGNLDVQQSVGAVSGT